MSLLQIKNTQNNITLIIQNKFKKFKKLNLKKQIKELEENIEKGFKIASYPDYVEVDDQNEVVNVDNIIIINNLIFEIDRKSKKFKIRDSKIKIPENISKVLNNFKMLIGLNQIEYFDIAESEYNEGANDVLNSYQDYKEYFEYYFTSELLISEVFYNIQEKFLNEIETVEDFKESQLLFSQNGWDIINRYDYDINLMKFHAQKIMKYESAMIYINKINEVK